LESKGLIVNADKTETMVYAKTAEPVWLTPYLRDPQPEGERESD